LEKRSGRYLGLERGAVLARNVVCVQADFGRERAHVGLPEHSTGQAGEVVLFDGVERARRDRCGTRDNPESQPPLLASVPEAGTNVVCHRFHMESR
jgi:hypothetical protein